MWCISIVLLSSLVILPSSGLAQQKGGPLFPDMIRLFSEDYGSLRRAYPLSMSDAHQARIRTLLLQWRGSLGEMPAHDFTSEDRVDRLLFLNYVDQLIAEHDLVRKQLSEVAPLLPFAKRLVALDEARRSMETVDPRRAAAEVEAVAGMITDIRDSLAEELKRGTRSARTRVAPAVANRAASACFELERAMERWNRFYSGYDPSFTWWVKTPYAEMIRLLRAYAGFLREEIAGVRADDRDAIIGDPIGREALLVALRNEMIAYSPEELVEIARREYAWCEREMKKASHELGYGDDWLQAVEHVKTLHRPPGDQPALIRELALEAIDFLETRDLLTIPPLAKETWRMEMMSAERQKISPFFTGGEVISVAFPLDTMDHEQKMMSLRGNNVHFSRATVHHELIPGHHLQFFMMNRYHTYREPFETPFWLEGWALYWEMRLWDLGFAQSPENRVGMLFWRMHRCARIIFSLSFHLGMMTPEECIEMLVNEVGHERENATAEVRRSFGGSYPPLYQAAYMVGALQFRALYREQVESGRMTEKEFHDRILQENAMPVEALRMLLTGSEVPDTPDPRWRFYPGMD